SATSPHTTNTTAKEKPSARPAGKASPEPARPGSSTTAGPPPTSPRRHHDLVHFQADLRGRLRHTSAVEGQGVGLGLGDLDAFGVPVGVVAGGDLEAGLGGRCADELDDRSDVGEGPSAPVSVGSA